MPIDKEEARLHLQLGVIIASSIAQSYCDSMNTEYKESILQDKQRYQPLIKKMDEAIKANKNAVAVCSRDLINDEAKLVTKEHIDFNFKVIFNVLSISHEGQEQVLKLVEKIRKKEKDWLYNPETPKI